MIPKMIVLWIVSIAILLLLVAGCSSLGRKHLFQPTHEPLSGTLTPWMSGDRLIGYARRTPSPPTVWLMLHGNAGQAAHRTYALPKFAPEDAVFILEYPGYGRREGKPSMKSFNQAAEEAYLLLRKTHPETPIGVVGESIGTGPASVLAMLTPPPDKIVLINPFDRLSRVAKRHTSSLAVALMLRDDWDNVESLSHYFGPVDIFASESDTIIPPAHGRALADAVPSSKLTVIEGGHNDWPESGLVRIRNP